MQPEQTLAAQHKRLLWKAEKNSSGCVSASLINDFQRSMMLALYQAPGVSETVGLEALKGSMDRSEC